MDRADTAMIILAGGASSRMGQDKCDLRLNGLTFLETQIRKGQQLEIPKIYVSGYKGKDCTQEISSLMPQQPSVMRFSRQ